jgi:uroporphyrin-III C-methyltransferase
VVNQLTEQQLKTPGFLDAKDYVQVQDIKTA